MRMFPATLTSFTAIDQQRFFIINQVNPTHQDTTGVTFTPTTYASKNKVVRKLLKNSRRGGLSK